MTAGDAQGGPAPSRAAFAFIFVTVALDMLALGIIVPVLPQLVVQFEGGGVARAAQMVGVFGFIWAAMQFVCAPVVGALSDRYGRRPVILLSNAGLGLDYIVMALAPTLPWLFVGRVISGITASSFPTAGAYVADVTPPDRRAARFGMLGAAFGLGFVIGPAVGGLLGAIDLRLPFWVAAALSFVNFAYGFFVLPESLPPARRARVSWRLANPVGSLVLLRAHPEIVGLAAAMFLYYVSHEVMPSLFVLYTTYRYAWGAREVGLALAVVGIASTIVSATLIGPIVQRIGERRAMLAGLAIGAITLLVFGLASTGTLFLLVIPFTAFMGLANPAMQAIASRRVAATEQGRLQGAIASVQGIAIMVGPVLFTQIFAVAIDTGGRRLAGVPLMVAAALLIAAAGVASRATGGTRGPA